MSSKWVIKQQRQLTISTTHLAQELLTNVQCSGGARSFATELRALKMKIAVAGHRKWKWPIESHHRSWSSYNYTRSCQRTQHRLFYSHWHLKQIGKVKKLSKWMPHEQTKSLILCNNKPFFSWIVMCNEKRILYDN